MQMRTRFLTLCLSMMMLLSLVTGCNTAAPGSSGSAEAPSSQTEEPASSPEATPNELPPDPLPTEPKTQVRVGALKGPTGMGLVQLMDKTDKESALCDYTFTLEGAPDVIQGPLVNGDLDIAILPTNLAAALHNKTEGEIQLLAVSGMRVLYVMARPDVEVASVADLAGKTLFTAGQGSTQEYVLDYLLRQSGLDPAADLTIEYKSEHAETVAQLLAGNCDVALLPQPFATTVLTQDADIKRVLDVTEEWDKASGGAELTMSCVVVRRAFAQERPQAVADFVAEYDESTQWVTANPDEAAELIGQYEIVPAAVAKQAIPGSAIQCQIGEEMQASVMAYLQVLFEQNPASVGGTLPDEEAFFCKLP